MPDAMEIIFQKALSVGKIGAVSTFMLQVFPEILLKCSFL